MKPCCSTSTSKGMAYCLECGRFLNSKPSHRRLYLGMSIVCAIVFSAVLIFDHAFHPREPVTVPSPTPIYVFLPAPSPDWPITHVPDNATFNVSRAVAVDPLGEAIAAVKKEQRATRRSQRAGRP